MGGLGAKEARNRKGLTMTNDEHAAEANRILTRMGNAVDAVKAERAALVAENARLREALKCVISSGENSARNGDDWSDVIIARSAWDMARAALSPKTEA